MAASFRISCIDTSIQYVIFYLRRSRRVYKRTVLVYYLGPSGGNHSVCLSVCLPICLLVLLSRLVPLTQERKALQPSSDVTAVAARHRDSWRSKYQDHNFIRPRSGQKQTAEIDVKFHEISVNGTAVYVSRSKLRSNLQKYKVCTV